uniref:Uncharacterized protein n=1 Tax=Candidatus Kentrum sp. TC TaxID=2126339 RepID=A0A450YIH0_9GAMM|nr:MAG: hypothetical protein BECKTC1821E_GA0114239_101126 [Candidatus Kentron sp. TC]VFK45265.1 MAG: hypothetical protein BECKTC1821D_GA0114238_102520 [Candidatus Kentron sp. TC]VFK63590.1 MAG: hypothetical protein BECKTC1821F_GA0114240_11011 [Candidatus Kentron sp. TC]
MLISSYFKYIAATFCIMHISRMHNDLDKITQRINDNMVFSFFDILAAILSPFFAARNGFGTLRIYYSVNRLPWWKIVRQHSPLCTSFSNVKDSVNDGMLFARGSRATIVRRLKIAFDKRALF